MKPSRVRIERFIAEMEARLAPPTDHRRWLRLLDPECGESDDAAITAHLAVHPEDGERLFWMQWVRTGVPRARDPVGERRSPDYQSVASEAAPEKPAAPPATVNNVTVEKPAASPAPEIQKEPGWDPGLDGSEPESNEVVAGFGRRLYYGPSGYWP
jgi:hypothetical protein